MSDLIYRLRCKYPNGPMVYGEPEFGWRDFGGPAPEGMVLPSPVMVEAAERIKGLEEALRKIEGIKWGYDGDCGAQAIIDSVFDA